MCTERGHTVVTDSNKNKAIGKPFILRENKENIKSLEP